MSRDLQSAKLFSNDASRQQYDNTDLWWLAEPSWYQTELAKITFTNVQQAITDSWNYNKRMIGEVISLSGLDNIDLETLYNDVTFSSTAGINYSPALGPAIRLMINRPEIDQNEMADFKINGTPIAINSAEDNATIKTRIDSTLAGEVGTYYRFGTGPTDNKKYKQFTTELDGDNIYVWLVLNTLDYHGDTDEATFPTSYAAFSYNHQGSQDKMTFKVILTREQCVGYGVWNLLGNRIVGSDTLYEWKLDSYDF